MLALPSHLCFRPFAIFSSFAIKTQTTRAYLTLSDYRRPCPAAEDTKISTRPATPISESWTREVRVCPWESAACHRPVKRRPTFIAPDFCVPDFGGSGSSMDDKNGYPQNRHLREAHQTLDNNLGKKSVFVLWLFLRGDESV